jgi:hypothetical protein
MFKFFLFLRHRDVESDILTAGTYKEGAAIWKTFKDKAYSRSLVGVRKLRVAAPNRLLAERHTAGYEVAYHRAQVSVSRFASARLKASLLPASILSQTVLSIRNIFSSLHINQRMAVRSTQPPSQKLRGRYLQIKQADHPIPYRSEFNKFWRFAFNAPALIFLVYFLPLIVAYAVGLLCDLSLEDATWIFI